MRHVVWLSGVLLALSCSVDNSNLNLDAGGSGGAGGCPRCVGTGGGGGGQTGGSTGTGGATAGAVGTGGSATGTGGGAAGGQTGTGGSAGGGQTGAGGSVAGAGGSVAGAGGSVAGAGGSGTGGNATGTGGKGTGGKGAGGTTGTGGGKGGQGGGTSCDTLANDYASALTAAKKCTPGATNQCQQTVESSIACPGCKTYVNDVTMLTPIETEWSAAGCAAMSRVCPAIACVLPLNSFCSGTSTGGGGANPSGMCVSALTPVGAN